MGNSVTIVNLSVRPSVCLTIFLCVHLKEEVADLKLVPINLLIMLVFKRNGFQTLITQPNFMVIGLYLTMA